MFSIIRKLLNRFYMLFRFPLDFIFVKVLDRYPVLYFDAISNVGDQINPYIISRLSGKKCHQVRSRLLKHAVCLGSMFHMANCKSVIWGTGIISDGPNFKNRTKCHSVKAVRGRLTEKILIENGIISPESVILGDPGLLMPIYYLPNIHKKMKVGIIPHYIDSNSQYLKGINSIMIIDVKQSPERFIDDILQCEFIVSSSLHGLILADSYGVPNKWVSFSDKITGGFFKFHDYYSTTNRPNEECVVIDREDRLQGLLSNIEFHASIKEYLFDKKSLTSSFPVI